MVLIFRDDYLKKFTKRSNHQGQYVLKKSPKKYIYDPNQTRNGYSIGLGKRAEFGFSNNEVVLLSLCIDSCCDSMNSNFSMLLVWANGHTQLDLEKDILAIE